METVNQRLLAGAGLASCQSKGGLQALHTVCRDFPAFEWDNPRKELSCMCLAECGPPGDRCCLHRVSCTCWQVAIMIDHDWACGLLTLPHRRRE